MGCTSNRGLLEKPVPALESLDQNVEKAIVLRLADEEMAERL